MLTDISRTQNKSPPVLIINYHEVASFMDSFHCTSHGTSVFEDTDLLHCLDWFIHCCTGSPGADMLQFECLGKINAL